MVIITGTGVFAILHGRPEFVLTDGFNGLLVQSHAQRSGYMDILRIALRVDDERNQADALILGAPRLIGEFGLHAVDHFRGGNPAADLIDPPPALPP